MRIADRPEYKSKRRPQTASPSDTVHDVVCAMNERNYGSAVVVDEEKHVIGIFTERDLLRRVVAPGKDPKATRLAEVMTTDVKLASSSDDVIVWLRQMSNERFRHLPVVDDHGKLEQILSQGDFVSYTWPELLSRLKEEVAYAYPRLASPIWLILGMAVYALAVIVVVRHAF